MFASCPLDQSPHVVLLDSIKTADLVKMYAKSFGLDVTSEFGGYSEIEFYHCQSCDLMFFFPMVAGSEQFYEAMQKFDWYYMDEKNEYDYARKFIKETDSVLEIGCGKGAFAAKVPAKNYVGLELSQRAIKVASSQGITVLNELIEAHAIVKPASYDVVCSFQVLEHVSKPKQFIESSILCLKPGGLLIFSTPSTDSFQKYVSNPILDMPPHHMTRWSDQAFKNLTQYFSLELVEIWHEPLQSNHRHLYVQTIFKNAFFHFLNRDIKTIDLNFSTKVINLVSDQLARFFVKGLAGTELLPRGMSVTAVYHKPAKPKIMRVVPDK